MRDEILTRLRLAGPAPGYKKAISALNQFIQLLGDKFSSLTEAGLIAENRTPPQGATQE